MDPCMLGDISGSPALSYFRGSELQSSLTVVSGRESFSNFHLPTAKDGVNLWLAVRKKGEQENWTQVQSTGATKLGYEGLNGSQGCSPSFGRGHITKPENRALQIPGSFLAPPSHTTPQAMERGHHRAESAESRNPH